MNGFNITYNSFKEILRDIQVAIIDYMAELYENYTFRGIVKVDESLTSHRSLYY